MWFLQAIGIIGRTIWAFVEVLFSLFSVYQQLSDLRTQIIATALGVPTILLSIGGIVLAVIKFLRKHA